MATKQIKIQTGVVKRLSREVEVYKDEAVKQQARIDKLVADGKDEHDVRKQVNGLRTLVNWQDLMW
jgi:tubulin-specific chaperone A